MSNSQVLTADQVRAAEQRIFDSGVTEFELMTIAAAGASEWVRRIAAGANVTVLCGPGNNGGDGYVIAHNLREAGNAVTVIAPVEPKTKSAQQARELWGDPVLTSGGKTEGHVLVDCLFGSGLSRPLSGEHALLLRDLAERHSKVIAIDVPSGIASDSGELLNERLLSFDVTLALGAWKYAHHSLPGRALMGTQRLVEFGIEPVEEAAQLISRPKLKAPPDDAHKYTRGFCAIVAGNLPGASVLAGTAAQRAGAGYVKLMMDGFIQQAPPSLPVWRAPESDQLADKRISAVLVGQGLGNTESALERLEAVLSHDLPTVIDAEGLRLLEHTSIGRTAPTLATPHDGELDSLCRTFSVIAEGRLDRARAVAKASDMVICAKGPDTVIAAPDGRIALAPPAPSWLSVAGSGDVLAGVAVSRMAAGRPPFEAACEAVWLHGEAARICGVSFTADDLAAAVSKAYAVCL